MEKPTVSQIKMRYYTPYESQRLSTECRGFLHRLELAGILNVDTRELVIEQALKLNIGMLDVAQLTWVVFMELLKKGDKAALQNILLYTQQPISTTKFH